MRGCVPWEGTTDAATRLTRVPRRCARLGGSRPLRITHLTYVELTRVLSSRRKVDGFTVMHSKHRFIKLGLLYQKMILDSKQ